MKLYKLTDKNNKTKNNTQWGENTTHIIPLEKRSNTLCNEGILHAHTDINLALLLNPIHANITGPNLWECEGEIVVSEWDKCGCHELTTTTQLDIPLWYLDDKIRKKVFFNNNYLVGNHNNG